MSHRILNVLVTSCLDLITRSVFHVTPFVMRKLLQYRESTDTSIYEIDNMAAAPRLITL